MVNVEAQLFTPSHLCKNVRENILLARSEIYSHISRKYHVSIHMYAFLVINERHEEEKSKCST